MDRFASSPRKLRAVLFFVAAAPLLSQCQKSSKKNDPAPVTTTETTSPTPAAPGTLAIGAFAEAVPYRVAVASPTAETTALPATAIGTIALPTSLTLREEGAGPALTTAAAAAVDKSYRGKLAKIDGVIRAKTIGDCAGALPSTVSFSSGFAQCFGPVVAFTDHPDGGSDDSFGALSTGIWWDYATSSATSGEACAAAKMNALLEEAAQYTDLAMGLHALVMCAAGVTKTDIPAVGATATNLVSTLSGVSTTDRGITVTAATLGQVAGTTADAKVFQSQIGGTVKNGVTSTTHPFTVNVTHVMEADQSGRGVLNYLVKGFSGIDGAYQRAVSVRYYYTTTGALTYRLVRSDFNAASTSIFATNGEVSPTKAGSGFACSGQGEGWCAAFNEAHVSIDNAGFGKLAYAVLAAPSTSAAAVFNVETKSDGTGAAFFGNSGAVAQTLGTDNIVKIEGLKCIPPIGGPLGDFADDYSLFVQKQTFAYGTTSKTWDLVLSNIRYAPTSTCSWNTTNDSTQLATFSAKTSDTAFENLAFPREHDLLGVATYTSGWSAVVVPSTTVP